MKKNVLVASLLFAGAFASEAQTLVQSFDDIQFWAGTGTNRSALVLQWNDGGTPTSLAWGYRWSGNATGIAMLKAIAGATLVTAPQSPSTVLDTLSGADSRLTLTIERYGFGDSIFSVSFNDGLQNRTRADWASGYWEYSFFGGNLNYDTYDANWNYTGAANYSQNGSSFYPSAWFSSPIGASDRDLVDGSWDAFSFAPGFVTSAVWQPYAVSVPEPSAAILLTIALFFFMLRQRIHA
ncbi:MAG: PEP-CTERM sorting domain-containing protein [bacterium]